MRLDLSLYGILERKWISKPLDETLKKACESGLTAIQVREKSISDKEFLEVAEYVKNIVRKYNVSLVINDRADIALAVDADGVHIGKNDLPIPYVRKIFPKYIGVSVHSLKDAIKAEKQGADYLGVGPVFPSKTKYTKYLVDMDELRKIKKNSKIPVIAIGGISAENIDEILKTGVNGIAVSQNIFSGEVRNNTEILRQRITKYVSR